MFKRGTTIWKSICLYSTILFIVSVVCSDLLRVKNTDASVLSLPEPTQLLGMSANHSLPLLKGLRFDLANPLNFDFILDLVDEKNIDNQQAQRLMNYFLAALTIPEQDVWVNLSPSEEDRIIPDSLSVTDLGRDMLGQDYMLKQLSSSLTHPDTETGQEYWSNIVGDVLAPSLSGKIWVKPDQSVVYENGNVAYIKTATLKVVTEDESGLGSILGKIEEDVNNGKNFAKLRQLYHTTLLAVWFKQKFKDSFYRNYIDQNKISGIDIEDKQIKEKIYNLYTEAYRKGVYNYIKKERDLTTKRKVNRHYFSGGIANLGSKLQIDNIAPEIAESKYMIVNASSAVGQQSSSAIGLHSTRLKEKQRAMIQPDIHGNFEMFKENLRKAGYIDKDNKWIAGDSVLVQLGDVIDRGDDSKAAYFFLKNLQVEAREAGGDVVRLMGNHELMLFHNDFSYVDFFEGLGPNPTQEQIIQAKQMAGVVLRDGHILKEIKEGDVKAAYVVNDVLVTHAGISPEMEQLIINEIVKEKGISEAQIKVEDIAEKLNQVLKDNVDKLSVFNNERSLQWAMRQQPLEDLAMAELINEGVTEFYYSNGWPHQAFIDKINAVKIDMPDTVPVGLERAMFDTGSDRVIPHRQRSWPAPFAGIFWLDFDLLKEYEASDWKIIKKQTVGHSYPQPNEPAIRRGKADVLCIDGGAYADADRTTGEVVRPVRSAFASVTGRTKVNVQSFENDAWSGEQEIFESDLNPPVQELVDYQTFKDVDDFDSPTGLYVKLQGLLNGNSHKITKELEAIREDIRNGIEVDLDDRLKDIPDGQPGYRLYGLHDKIRKLLAKEEVVKLEESVIKEPEVFVVAEELIVDIKTEAIETSEEVEESDDFEIVEETVAYMENVANLQEFYGFLRFYKEIIGNDGEAYSAEDVIEVIEYAKSEMLDDLMFDEDEVLENLSTLPEGTGQAEGMKAKIVEILEEEFNASSALRAQKNKLGGIDLKHESFDLQIEGQGIENFKIDSMINSPEFKGFSLNIISIREISTYELTGMLVPQAPTSPLL